MKYATTPCTEASALDLNWMAGAWHGTQGNSLIEEHWSQAAGGTLMGMFRWLKDDSVWFYELLVIETEEDQLVLRIKHFSPGLMGWEEKDQVVSFVLVEIDKGKAVFMQQNKPEPVWLVYKLANQHTLITYFEKEEEQTKDEEKFIFNRKIT